MKNIRLSKSLLFIFTLLVITISFGACSKEVVGIKEGIVKIEVTRLPNELNYLVGQKVDLYGLIITGTDHKGEKRVINHSEFTKVVYENNSIGVKEVKVYIGEVNTFFKVNYKGEYDYTKGLNGITITKYNGIDTVVNIPSEIDDLKVVEIAVRAFESKKLTQVTLPTTIKKIGKYAFAFNQIEAINLPEGLETIEAAAFLENQIRDLVVPSTITIINPATFSENKISSLKFNGNITSIGEHAFSHNLITSLPLPSSVTDIKDMAFYNNKISKLSLPSNLKRIETSAFETNLISSLTIPASVELINTGAFKNNKLTNLTVNMIKGDINSLAFEKNAFADPTTIFIAQEIIVAPNAFDNYVQLQRARD